MRAHYRLKVPPRVGRSLLDNGEVLVGHDAMPHEVGLRIIGDVEPVDSAATGHGLLPDGGAHVLAR